MGFMMYLLAKTKLPIHDEVSIFCSLCNNEIDDGYFCRDRGLILCEACQEGFNMHRCPHKNGEHQHIKWPGNKDKNENYMEEICDVSNRNQRIRKEGNN